MNDFNLQTNGIVGDFERGPKYNDVSNRIDERSSQIS